MRDIKHLPLEYTLTADVTVVLTVRQSIDIILPQDAKSSANQKNINVPNLAVRVNGLILG